MNHPRLILAGAASVSLVATFLVLELVARALGGEPGQIASATFHDLANAQPVSGLIADSHGIMKYDPALRPAMRELIAEAAPDSRILDVFGRDFEPSVRYMVESFAGANAEAGRLARFPRAMSDLRAVPSRDERQQALLDYAALPLNRAGFRSLRFSALESDRPSVLLLGDSFTFGYSAKPLTQSFADLLLLDGYVVYNTGIPAVAPSQYVAIAERYIPELRPDVVIVNFYLGNDMMSRDHVLEAHRFTVYPTTAGFVSAAPMGEHLGSLAAARDYLLDFERIPDQKSLWFNRACAQTVLGTRLWSWLASNEWVERRSRRFVPYIRRNELGPQDQVVSGRQMAHIRDLAEAHGAKFVLAVIPDLFFAREDPSTLFAELAFHQPDLVAADFESGPNPHFNNQGHRKYAEFLKERIDAAAP